MSFGRVFANGLFLPFFSSCFLVFLKGQLLFPIESDVHAFLACMAASWGRMNDRGHVIGGLSHCRGLVCHASGERTFMRESGGKVQCNVMLALVVRLGDVVRRCRT